MKPNYVVIPAIVIVTAVVGSRFVNAGMEWYRTIHLPAITPPGWFIGVVWNVIFVLTTISAILVWNRAPHRGQFWAIVVLFLVNAVLNAMWSYVFFVEHAIGGAIVEMLVLLATVLAMIVLIRPISILAAELLIPYAAWVGFATYLTTEIWRLNKVAGGNSI